MILNDCDEEKQGSPQTLVNSLHALLRLIHFTPFHQSIVVALDYNVNYDVRCDDKQRENELVPDQEEVLKDISQLSQGRIEKLERNEENENHFD